MKKKIKSLVQAISIIAMTFPALALAAFPTPSGLPGAGAGGYQLPGGTGLPTGSVSGIVTNIMNWLLLIIGIVGVIGFAIAGILYLTSAGDEERIEKAKQAMLYSIIGVIVALAGVLALKAAAAMLGGTNYQF